MNVPLFIKRYYFFYIGCIAPFCTIFYVDFCALASLWQPESALGHGHGHGHGHILPPLSHF
jgi:hypothetical protein